MHFDISMDFVCKMTREKMTYGNDIAGAISLLRESFITEDMTDEKRREVAGVILDVLDGKAELTGSMTEGCKVQWEDENKDRHDIADWNENLLKKISDLEEQLKDIQERYCFVTGELTESQYNYMDRAFRAAYEKPLFEGLQAEQMTSTGNTLLDDYLSHQHNAKDDDYGWLSPDGEFTPVEWGNHGSWAQEYVEKNGLEHEYYGKYSTPGDYLVFARGWILLHSPSQGNAHPTYDNARKMTKAQQEFLFDYFTKRGRSQDAAALYKED